MAEQSMLWTTNNTGDGPSSGYSQARWAEFLNDVFNGGQQLTKGILKGVGSELAVSGAASPVAVAAGAAIVYGFYYKNTASVNLAVTTPVVGTTGGHVILRADWTAQTVRLVLVRNTDGLSAIPALTQTVGSTFEIRLASFTITTGGVITLTDVRGFANFSSQVVSAMIANLNVLTQHLANDSVDDTKAGDRVLRLDRRQGGSSSVWSTAGSTNYTPTAVREQAGVASFPGVVTTFTVTFPTAFSQAPVVTLSALSLSNLMIAVLQSVSATGFTFVVYVATVLNPAAFQIAPGVVPVHWAAVGPE